MLFVVGAVMSASALADPAYPNCDTVPVGNFHSDPTASSRMTAKGNITQYNSTPRKCYQTQTNTDTPNEARMPYVKLPTTL
jgi:hypothetical protein